MNSNDQHMKSNYNSEKNEKCDFGAYELNVCSIQDQFSRTNMLNQEASSPLSKSFQVESNSDKQEKSFDRII